MKTAAWIFGILAGLLLVTGVVLFIAYRKEKKKNTAKKDAGKPSSEQVAAQASAPATNSAEVMALGRVVG